MVDLAPAGEAAFGRESWQRVERLCLCAGCPSYPEADRGRKTTYCLRGDSDHREAIRAKVDDCLCESCEVYKHGRLYGANFFCLEGAALQQGIRNVLAGTLVTHLPEKKEHVRTPLFVSAGLDVRKGEKDEETSPG